MFQTMSSVQNIQNAKDRQLMPPPKLPATFHAPKKPSSPAPVVVQKPKTITPLSFVSNTVQKGTFGGYAKTGDDAQRKTAVTYEITYKYTRPNYVVTDDPNLWNDSQMLVEDVNTEVPNGNKAENDEKPADAFVKTDEKPADSTVNDEVLAPPEVSEKLEDVPFFLNILEGNDSDGDGDADPSEVERIILGLDTLSEMTVSTENSSSPKKRKSRSKSESSDKDKEKSERKKRHSKHKKRKKNDDDLEAGEIPEKKSKKKSHRNKEKSSSHKKKSSSSEKTIKSPPSLISERLEKLTEPLSPERADEVPENVIPSNPSISSSKDKTATVYRNGPESPRRRSTTKERDSPRGSEDRFSNRDRFETRPSESRSEYSTRSSYFQRHRSESRPRERDRSSSVSSQKSGKGDPAVKNILDLIEQHITKEEGQVLSDSDSETESVASISGMSVFKDQPPTSESPEANSKHRRRSSVHERRESGHRSQSRRSDHRNDRSVSRSRGKENPPRRRRSLSPLNHRRRTSRSSPERHRRRSNSPSMSVCSRSRNLGRPTRRHRASSYDTVATSAIDKIKLREVAVQNAVLFRQIGRIPPQYAMSREERRIWQSGGKTLDDLTAFCKRMAQKRKDGDDDRSSVDSELPIANHPYHVRDRPLINEISFSIRNSRTLPVRSAQERLMDNLPLREVFPVSSGSVHRDMTWQRVVSREKPVPQLVMKQPEAKKSKVAATAEDPPERSLAEQLATAPPPPDYRIPISFSDKLRLLKFQRDLAMNPDNPEILTQMQETHQQMLEWANQFVYQGAPGELGEKQAVEVPGKNLHQPWEKQAWVRKDQLMNLSPVTGKGHYLLLKMGWQVGQRIGLRQTGALEPIKMEIKLNKRGLVASGEKGGKPAVFNVGASGPFPFAGYFNQHPCSALNEYCTKSGLGTPTFTAVSGTGGSYRSMFMFQVEINGVTYRPTVSGLSKKQAKAEAAQFCLSALGACK